MTKSGPKVNWPLITGLWLVLVLAAIYVRPLMPIDETRYVSVAWEMWNHGQFLVPHINGAPYSQKPPLLFWLIQLGWLVFGVNEWSARLTAPLFALACLFLTARLARRLWPGHRGVEATAPFILLGMPLWAVFGTLTMFDMLLAFFALLGALGILRAAAGEQRAGWLLTGCAVGGGILAKGPVILVSLLPLMLLAPWWAVNGHGRSWGSWYKSALGAILLGAAIALAWALPAAKAGGKAYADAILWGQTAGRMVHSFAHQRPFWWYLPLLPAALFPWCFALPFWRGLKSVRLDQGMRFCLTWFITSLLTFSLVSGKQIHYLLPMLPACALMVARSMDGIKAVFGRKDLLLVAVIFILLSIFLALLPEFAIRSSDLAPFRQMSPLWSIGVLVLGLALLLRVPRNLSTMVKGLCAAVTILLLLIQLGPFRSAAPAYDLRPIAGRIAHAQAKGETVAIYPGRYADQFQFAGRLQTPLVALPSRESVNSWAKNNPSGDLVMVYGKGELKAVQPGPVFSHPFKRGVMAFWRLNSLPAGSSIFND